MNKLTAIWFISFLFLVEANAQNIPAITLVSPESGSVGSTVTIKGTNFSTNTSDNIVFFGATQAVVNTATTTDLSVTVPVGATYNPISVTVSGLTCFSSNPFVPTFSGNQVIDYSSFGFNVDFTTGFNHYSIAIGDIDGDGKPDLVVSNSLVNSISIFRNTGAPSPISAASFATKVDFTTGLEPTRLSLGDLDGDGKLDIVVANRSESSVSVFKNISTSGSITTKSLAARVDFTTGSSPNAVAIGDLDADGKLDLVSTNSKGSTVSILKNTGSIGVIDSKSFATKIDIAMTNPWIVALGDLDADGKLDLAVSNNFGNVVSIFKNNTKTGVIDANSFAAKVDFKTGTYPTEIAIGDLNGNGKPEMVVANLNGSSVSVFENTTVAGSINATSFATKVDFSAPSGPGSVAIGDLNGDGKPDLAVASSGDGTFQGTTVSVMRNLNSSGVITNKSFDANYSFTAGTEPYSVAIGDLDGDQKPDLAVANASSKNISVIPSTIPVAVPLPSIISFTPISGSVGTSVTITGTNFSNVASSNIVKFNGVTATVLSSSTSSITTSVPIGATTGNITVAVGGQTATSKEVFTVTTVATVLITTQPVSTTKCAGDTTSFAVTASGANLKYQWQVRVPSSKVFVDVTNTGGYTGASSTKLRISNASSGMEGNYRAKITDVAGLDVFSDTVTFTINAVPTAPTILTLNPEACDTTFTLQVQGAGKYKWSLANQLKPDTLKIIAQTIVLLGQTSVTLSQVSNFKQGQNKLYLTTSNNLCSRIDSTILSYYPKEIPLLSSNAIEGDSVRLIAQPVVRGNATYSGTWSTKGNAIIKNPTLASTIVNKLSLGTNTFVYSLNNLCKTSDSISVTYSAIPTVFSGKDSVSCDSSVILKATVVTQQGYRGFWRIAGKKANGTIVADTTKASTLAKLSFGANAFIWTVTNGQFLKSDTVTYTRSGLPNKPTIALASSEACGASQILQITISANDASNKYKWTRVGAQGTDTLRILSTQIQQGTQGNINILTTVSSYKTGSNNLLLTTSNVSKCMRTDQATLSYFPNEIPILSSNPIVGDSVRLIAQPVIRGNVTFPGTWSVIKGNAVIKNITLANPIAGNLSIGQNIFVYTLGNTCKTNDTLIVNYLPTVNVNAGIDKSICSDTTTLTAVVAQQGFVGVWRSINKSVVFNDSTKASTKVSGLTIGGNRLSWNIKSGSTTLGSDTITITRNKIPVPQIASYLTVCKPDTNLAAKLNTGETGSWKNIGNIATQILTVTSPTTKVTGLIRFRPESTNSINMFEWTVKNGACQAKDTLPVYLADSIKILDNTISGIAGELLEVKVYKDYKTSFAGIYQGLKVVGLMDKAVIDTSYTKGDTSVFFLINRKLLTKNYTTNYSLSNSCGVTSNQITLNIAARNVKPNTSDIRLAVNKETILYKFIVSGYDLDSNQYIKKVEFPEKTNNGANLRVEYALDNSAVTFFADYSNVPDFTGVDSFNFRLFDQEDTVSRQVYLTVDRNLGLIIYNAISPNGDGKHDVFEIKGIEQQQYKDNKVEVFNRWGDRVYKASGYNNQDVSFDGASLPDGTYYYLLDLGENRKLLKGFVVLKR